MCVLLLLLHVRYEVLKKSRRAADELAELLLQRFVDPRRGAVHCGIIYCLSRSGGIWPGEPPGLIT